VPRIEHFAAPTRLDDRIRRNATATMGPRVPIGANEPAADGFRADSPDGPAAAALNLRPRGRQTQQPRPFRLIRPDV